MDTDQDLVRALHRAGTSDPGVDTRALAAGARGRARTIRRRRQGGVGLAAVVALAIPVGISQWPSASVQPIAPATRTATAPVSVDSEVVPSAMLPDESVLAVLPTAVGTDGESFWSADSPTLRSDYGMCVDSNPPGGGAGGLYGSRTRDWATDVSVGDPFPPNVSETVRVFSDQGAQSVVDFARDQLATGCGPDTDETGQWFAVPSIDGAVTLDTGGAALGDDSVIGYAVMSSGDNPMWRTRIVVAQGDAVLDLRTELGAPTAQEAVQTSYDLATEALQRVVDEVPAAGGQQ